MLSLQHCYCSDSHHSLKMYIPNIIRVLIFFPCVHIHLTTKQPSLSRLILLPNKAKLTDNQLKLGQWADTFPPVWLPFRLLTLIRVCLLLQHKTELCQDQSKNRSIVQCGTIHPRVTQTLFLDRDNTNKCHFVLQTGSVFISADKYCNCREKLTYIIFPVSV